MAIIDISSVKTYLTEALRSTTARNVAFFFLGVISSLIIAWIVFSSGAIVRDIVNVFIFSSLIILFLFLITRIMLQGSVSEIKESKDLEDFRSRFSNIISRNPGLIAFILSLSFALFIIQHLLNISSTMLDYLQVDNVEKQNALLVQQNDSVIIDGIIQLDARLEALERENANLQVVKLSWVDVGIPYYLPGQASKADAYICERNDGAFLCDDERVNAYGAEVYSYETIAQIGRAVIWFSLERSKTDAGTWGTYSNPSESPRRIISILDVPPDRENFHSGLTSVCGLNEAFLEASRRSVDAMDEIERAFLESAHFWAGIYSGNPEKLPASIYSNWVTDIDSLEFDNLQLFNNLKKVAESSSMEGRNLRNVMFGAIRSDDPNNPEVITEALAQLVFEFYNVYIASESQLSEFWGLCDRRIDAVDEGIRVLSNAREALFDRLSVNIDPLAQTDDMPPLPGSGGVPDPQVLRR